MLNNLTNFFNLITNKMIKKVPEATDLIALGTRDQKYYGNYKPTGILYEDLKADVIDGISCLPQFGFKPGSVGEKVSFRKVSGTNPVNHKDVIIEGELEITRGANGGGIYNIAIESSYNQNSSPENTMWATKFNNPTLDGWAPLWNINLNDPRVYEKWRAAVQVPEGNNNPPLYVGMPVIMQFDNGSGTTRYWLILFTEWGVGQHGEYGFAYDRWEILPEVSFEKPDYSTETVDVISAGVHLARGNNGALYNAVVEPDFANGASPINTRWNSIYTDSRTGYYGYDDLSNLESRVYTDFTAALDGSVGNNIFDTLLIMHDLTTDLYYRISFDSWTSNNQGGGFAYRRTLIPQSCGVKFADGTVMNTAPVSGSTDKCCSVDAEGNFIAANSGSDTVNIGAGGSQDIPDFSGMLIVNDHFNGGVELWLCGGGSTAVLVSSTPYGPGPGTMTINGAINGYTWTNFSNQVGPFTFTVIKTRLGS